MTSTSPQGAPDRSAPTAPSLGWAVRRAVLGLAIMFVVTGLAAYIAHASIDTTGDGPADAYEPGSGGIKIGLPAAALIKRRQ